MSPLNGFECPQCKNHNDVKFHPFIRKTWNRVLYIGINIPLSSYILFLYFTKDKDISLIYTIIISLLVFIFYNVVYFFTTKINY